MSISFSVNGVAKSVPAEQGDHTLLDFLHDELNLTGTKLCCGIGVCRACTVSVTKGPATSAMISCSTPLSVLDGTDIQTVEGVAPPLRAAARPRKAPVERLTQRSGAALPILAVMVLGLLAVGIWRVADQRRQPGHQPVRNQIPVAEPEPDSPVARLRVAAGAVAVGIGLQESALEDEGAKSGAAERTVVQRGG